MTPNAGVPPVLPLICQKTGTAIPPESVATQAIELPEVTLKFDVEPLQLIVLIAVAGKIVIVAVAVKEVCVCAIAVMVTTLLVGTVGGAVYLPLVSIVPNVEFPPATPPACQLTRVLLKFAIVWVQDAVPFTVTEVWSHEIVKVGVDVVELEPPHEVRASRTGRSAKISKRRCHCTFFAHTEH